MATYLGVPYHAGLGPDGNEATLFSPAPPPDELGFTPTGGYWRKQVLLTDLDALWQSRLVGAYRGEPCLVLDDLGDRLHIAYLGRDSVRARQLGYWEIDREVFEVVVARQDIAGLTEERVDYQLASAMFPPSTRGPAAQVRTQAPGRGAGGPQPGGHQSQAGGPQHQPGGPQPQPDGPPTAVAAERTGPLRVLPHSGSQPVAEPTGYREPATYRGPGGYTEAGGYTERGGYAERVSSTPDRVAAWHGSPETEPWAGAQPDPYPEPRADPRSGPQPVFRADLQSDPGLPPRPDSRTDPRSAPGPDSRTDPRSEPRTDPRSESRTDPRSEPRPEGWPTFEPWSESKSPAKRESQAGAPSGRRAGRRDRVPQSVFADLLTLAAIPDGAYAVDEEVPGAMCLVKADGGFEVFSRTDSARLDVRFFEDEEAAYFYLFGVLAAEAVCSGRLRPETANGHVNGSRGPGIPSAPTENVSKYLRAANLPKSAPHPVIVN
jgi:hypothetical protein